MYVIVKDHEEKRHGEYSEENREFRNAYHETRERLAHLHPKDLSALRRFAIKKSRFQGKRPEIIAEAAAIRRLMEEEVNR